MADERTTPTKDKWDKAGVILEPVGGLLTAIAVGALGFFGSQALEHRQTLDSNYRLYSELMSKREESESALRKDMFKSIIDSFLKPGGESTPLESKVLNLELLAYNFHESLDLKPLFVHLHKLASRTGTKGEREDYLDRLNRVAREVVRKQMLVLEEAGAKFERSIDFDSLRNAPGGIELDAEDLKVEETARNFRVIVLALDTVTQELKVRLEVRTPAEGSEPNVAEFWISFFDFPMIDNTRLSHDQRCAITLSKFEDGSAEISVVYFPGSHAGLKEKPYFDEVVHNLLVHGDQSHAQSSPSAPAEAK